MERMKCDRCENGIHFPDSNRERAVFVTDYDTYAVCVCNCHPNQEIPEIS